MADEIDEFLEERIEEGTLRTLKPISKKDKAVIQINNKEYIDFSSNDYLGLSGHPKLIAAGKKAMDEFGTSSSASRLLSGDLDLHHKLEEKIALFKHKEAALVFNSGYQANVAIISCLFKKGDCIFSDRLNHASIIDGILLSGATLFRFQHNDVLHLEILLKKERNRFKRTLIITESIFSMDGDKAPLKELVNLKEKYNCQLFVDEAHATCIFGKDGNGLAEEEGLSEKIDFIMGTFSKALGSFGAYLATSGKTVQYLVNSARGFIYSTALPPAVIACNLASMELVKDEPYRRKELLKCAAHFRQKLSALGFLIKGASQIVPVIIGKNRETQEFARRLQEKGYWVLPIRPPTVPLGQARLRFSLSYYHKKEVLEKLIDEIARIKI